MWDLTVWNLLELSALVVGGGGGRSFCNYCCRGDERESLKYDFKGWLLLGFRRQNSLGELWKLVWDHCRISFVFPVCSILFCRDGVQEPAAETGSFLCHQECWETME